MRTVVNWKEISETEGEVVGFYQLEDKDITEEVLNMPNTVIINEMPFPKTEIIDAGDVPEYRVNLETKEVYYVIVKAPETAYDIIQRLDTENKALKKTQADQDEIIMQIMLGGM